MARNMCFLITALFMLISVKGSTQFIVANCVWDDAVAAAIPGDQRTFALSDADACALFCSGNGGSTASSSSSTPTGSAPSGMCDRCCRSNQPPSRPGELLVSILHTLIKAFGASGAQSTSNPSSTPSTTDGESSSNTPSGGVNQQSSTNHDEPTRNPRFDDITGTGGEVADFQGAREQQSYRPRAENLNNERPPRHYQPGPSTSSPRRNRAYPEAGIVEISGRSGGLRPDDRYDHRQDQNSHWVQAQSRPQYNVQ